MNFIASMRIGSLEMLAALLAFGAVAARLRPGGRAPRPKALSLGLRLRDGYAGTTGRDMVKMVAEGEPCVIGRSGQAAIELADPEVSRQHARLELVKGVLYVADLRSKNGTFLNGKPLGEESIEVRLGDDIDVGNTRITITGTEPAS